MGREARANYIAVLAKMKSIRPKNNDKKDILGRTWKDRIWSREECARQILSKD